MSGDDPMFSVRVAQWVCGSLMGLCVVLAFVTGPITGAIAVVIAVLAIATTTAVCIEEEHNDKEHKDQ